MVFYQNETLIGLLLSIIPACFSLHFFFNKLADRKGIVLLMISAFLIRLLMISLDPFLHPWDERFHALVAKNIMDHPFKPMLFIDPIMPYNIADWSGNHVWLNKPPLFLWQMAASMKIFGINTFALRLPSAMMGTILVWLTYDLAKRWVSDKDIAYIAAFLMCFNIYSLELVSGRYGLDHNDMAFVFYITCSLWAFTKYVESGFKLSWGLLAGIFSGFAIMNKWLAGLLVFAAWGLYLVTSNEYRTDLKKYFHLVISFGLACLVFLPWQFYIHAVFPAESAIVSTFHQKHFSDSLDHPGSIFFHISFLPILYDYFLLIFFVVGLLNIRKIRGMRTDLTLSFLLITGFVYLFFSFFVQTKMPSYVFIVSPLILILTAVGLHVSISVLKNKLALRPAIQKLLIPACILLTGLLALKPWTISVYRSENNIERNRQIFNANIYKNIKGIVNERAIINCRAFEHISLMFFSGANAYHYYPNEQLMDSLQNAGHTFAAFNYTDQQKLPDYITNDKEILILTDQPR